MYCLASGSSANALLMVAGDRALLIDAGLGVRTLKRELEARGVSPASVAGVLLTHEHIDHVRGAVPFARKYNVPLVTNRATLDALFAQERRDAPCCEVATNGETGIGPFAVRALPVSHDAAEPVGLAAAVMRQSPTPPIPARHAGVPRRRQRRRVTGRR